jgi:hypothetical protein
VTNRTENIIPFILSAVLSAAAGAADMTVTQEMLLHRTIPAITSLSNDGTGDWTSVGETQRTDRNQERAHLNDDGELVLVDDAGFQYHAVWAASRPVTPAMSWEVSFRYIPVPNPDTKYYDAGGWTFVMQNQGATAYGTSSPLLGVPATGAYGFMFHRYYLGVRWIKNSNSINTPNHATWTHIKGKNRYDANIEYTEGLDIDMTNAIDVTIGCTGRVWTVTMQQEGKDAIVMSNDFSDVLADDGMPYHLGFTGSSSWWNVNHLPVMYQKIADVTGAIGFGSAKLVAAGRDYALANGAWKTAEYATFVDEGRLLVLDPYTATGNRLFAATGQVPLYRKLPFSLSFEWECEYGTKGAQGVSFSLVPNSEPKGGGDPANTWGDFFYPTNANAAGFFVRPYGNDGFGWHQGGVRTLANVPYSNITSGDVMYVAADWDGDSKMVVSIRRNSGITVVKTNTFDNLPDVFYPAFHGATAFGADGPTRFVVQNYALRVLDNPAPVELGDADVAGATEYVLSTWSADAAGQPSAVAGTLSMQQGAALTLSPDANGLGGSLFASNIEVCATSGIAATSPCATVLSRLSYPADATLALTGRAVAAADPVTVWCAKDAFRPGRHLLLDATGVTGLEGASFVLAEGADAIPRDRCRLEWNGETLVLVVKGGLLILFR